MLTSKEFTNIWKPAQVKPSPKISKPTQFSDFRPISLLFYLGKATETVMINKITTKLLEIVDT